MAQEKAQKQNVGNAGEYYIASRLSAINFTATITLGRAEKYDILALSPSGRLVKISVKATQNEKATDFPLSAKDEKGEADDFYYAFVKLNGFEKDPDFWIIPSKIACPLIEKAQRKWEATPGKNGRPHSLDNTMRILPIELRGSNKVFYPPEWENEVKTYYKNLKQLL
ncbi:MAG: hypothetical protein NTY81_02015 [Candidatus Staskawiczbacteria bacterium]|nr:hypothetical protein [Candidatus Staskawiczbacteria bacterium]